MTRSQHFHGFRTSQWRQIAAGRRCTPHFPLTPLAADRLLVEGMGVCSSRAHGLALLEVLEVLEVLEWRSIGSPDTLTLGGRARAREPGFSRAPQGAPGERPVTRPLTRPGGAQPGPQERPSRERRRTNQPNPIAIHVGRGRWAQDVPLERGPGHALCLQGVIVRDLALGLVVGRTARACTEHRAAWILRARRRTRCADRHLGDHADHR